MKLSEAILLGSIGSDQGFGHMSGTKSSKDKCAIGAALLATGREVESNAIYELTVVWPWVLQVVPAPHGVTPLESHVEQSVRNYIWWLNDRMKWTRPQIAAWVASMEPQEEPITVPIKEEVYSEVK